MAGTFAYLRFSASARAPADLVARLHAFAEGRLTERAVARLEWPQVHGISAEDWALESECVEGPAGVFEPG